MYTVLSAIGLSRFENEERSSHFERWGIHVSRTTNIQFNQRYWALSI